MRMLRFVGIDERVFEFTSRVSRLYEKRCDKSRWQCEDYRFQLSIARRARSAAILYRTSSGRLCALTHDAGNKAHDARLRVPLGLTIRPP